MKSKIVFLLIASISVYALLLHNQTVSFDYVVTEINENEYFGESLNDETGIYFTSSDISDSIEVGDKVKATFEKDNTVDGLISIEKN